MMMLLYSADEPHNTGGSLDRALQTTNSPSAGEPSVTNQALNMVRDENTGNRDINAKLELARLQRDRERDENVDRSDHRMFKLLASALAVVGAVATVAVAGVVGLFAMTISRSK